MTEPQTATGRHFRGDDWYGDVLGAARFVGCDFRRTSSFDATLDGCHLVGTSAWTVPARGSQGRPGRRLTRITYQDVPN